MPINNTLKKQWFEVERILYKARPSYNKGINSTFFRVSFTGKVN